MMSLAGSAALPTGRPFIHDGLLIGSLPVVNYLVGVTAGVMAGMSRKEALRTTRFSVTPGVAFDRYLAGKAVLGLGSTIRARR